MGCCLSTTEQNPNNQNDPKNHQPQLRLPVPKSNSTHEVYHRAPTSAPVEEESVKEVLSETPISKPQKVPILIGETKTQMPKFQNQAQKSDTKGSFNNKSENEVCSMSESLSLSTTTTATSATVADKREDEATSKRSIREGTQKWNRSPSYASRKRPYAVDSNSTGGRERRAKSPARRPGPSPEKKNQVSSRSIPGRGRESGQVAIWKHNPGSSSPGVRRHAGEGSVRRSRSPSSTRTASAGGGRSQVKALGGTDRRLAPDKGLEKDKSRSEKVGEGNDGVQQESLENPHVSLECFIFL